MMSGPNNGGGPGSPGPDDREDIDSAFAAIIAHYSDEAAPDQFPPLTADSGTPAEAAPAEPEPARSQTDGRPLFHYVPKPEPETNAGDEVTNAVEEDESFELEPLPPARRPSAAILVGWLLLGFSIVCALIAMFGVSLPRWLGWAAVSGFAGGFGLLILQLPWHRSPDDGDGAVL